MFEKFFNKPKEETGPKPLIPDFVEDPDLQNIVKECIGAWRNAFAYMHDGQPEEAKKYNEEVDKLLNEKGDLMRIYLQPYIDLGPEKLKQYARESENDRRQVATLIMDFYKDK